MYADIEQDLANRYNTNVHVRIIYFSLCYIITLKTRPCKAAVEIDVHPEDKSEILFTPVTKTPITVPTLWQATVTEQASVFSNVKNLTRNCF